MHLRGLVLFIISSGIFPWAMAQDLQSFLESSARKHNVNLQGLSAYVISDDTAPRTLLDVNSNLQRSIASASKVVTSMSVLSNFSIKESFATTIKTATPVRGAVYPGSIYLVGGGDPSFGEEGLNKLGDDLHKKGLRKIKGDLIVDETLFPEIKYLSRDYRRTDDHHDARIGAMSFNWNSFTVFIRPGKIGEKAKVEILPANDYIKVVGSVKTVRGTVNNTRAERRELSPGKEVLRLSGTLGSSYRQYEFQKNVANPALWSGANLRYALAKKGIQVSGQVKLGTVPDKAMLLGQYRGHSISQLLADLNKESNNVVAEMLAVQIGLKNHQAATVSAGVGIINQELARLNMDPAYQFLNPAGLNHGNKMSSRDMLKVFLSVSSDDRKNHAFMDSLPIAGIDGTLKKRGPASEKVEWLRAKTGYMKNVVSLVGQVRSVEGKVYSFSFLYNGQKADREAVLKFYVDVLDSIVEAESTPLAAI